MIFCLNLLLAKTMEAVVTENTGDLHDEEARQ